jgi:hypothetical protein
VKENEAADVLALLKGAFPAHKMDPTDREVWMESFRQLDADLATQAVLRGRNEWVMFPSWARFREAYRLQERLREPVGEQRAALPPIDKNKMPLWIRRWAAARYLYKRFGREQDMRRFVEQGDYADPMLAVMPDGEWEKEAERVTDKDVWGAVRG